MCNDKGRWLPQALMDALICPRCGGSVQQRHVSDLVCQACQTEYPVKDGIVLLCEDYEAITRNIKGGLTDRKNWYVSDQIRSVDEGHYRHHIKKRIVYLEEMFERLNLQQPKILDAGCGDGANLRHLLRINGATVYGSDYNFLRLTRAKKLFGASAYLFLGSLLENNIKDNFLDLVFCSHVLEHIQDDLTVLRNLHRVLKPGGTLILGVPNEGAWLWLLDYHVFERYILQRTDHVHFYTRDVLLRLLTNVGFDVQETKYLGWGIPVQFLDAQLRQFKWIDDLFELIGKRLCESQATSMYFICQK